MRKMLPLICCVLLIGTSCKSTYKAYQKGDYEKAIFNSLDRLRRSPDNKKSRKTLQEAYPLLQSLMLEQVNQAQGSSDPLRWETIMDYYRLLNRVYSGIQRTPAARDVIQHPRSYDKEYETAKRNAAAARYALGERALRSGQNGDREAAKDAYLHFNKTEKLIANYRDAYRLSQVAMELATLFIEVEPIPMHSRRFELTHAFFENQLYEALVATQLSPFVAFYPATANAGPVNGPDHILRMRFDDFVVGQAYIKEKEVERVRENVVISERQISEDSVEQILGTVKATVHQFRKEISSSGLLDVQIIDSRTGTILAQRKFPGTFVWVDRWGFFNGDDRALTDEDKRFTRKRRQAPDPLPQDLFIEFTRPIYDQVVDYVRAYYRRA